MPSRLHHLLGALIAALVVALANGVHVEDGDSAGESGAYRPARVAPHVDLSEPLDPEPPEPERGPEPEPAVPTPLESSEPAVSSPSDPSGATADALGEAAPDGPPAAPDAAAPREMLLLLGEQVAPGTSVRLAWSPDQSFEGIAVPTAVLVVHGLREGPTLCVTAALHGDELNGIEIVRRVLYDLDAQKLSGTVIGVPIVNLHGFRRGSRYLPDRRDLNRFFPGSDDGSSASRIAHSFFSEVIDHCNALVDIHTGSFQRTNLPQLRADMRVAAVADLTKGFAATSVLHSDGEIGTLRRAAVEAGIPAVTLETGEPGRLQQKKIEHGTQGIRSLLHHLGMYERGSIWGTPEPVYYESTWVRADRGGLLFGEVSLGQRVRQGELLGTVTDPITNLRSELRSPLDGRVLGMALNQVVMPGFAAFRIGIPTTDSELATPGLVPEPPPDPEEPAEGDARDDPDEENS